MTITKWWGVRLIHKYLNYFCADILPEINSSRFPVWASLAKDYLSIMVSLVSSERAFSSAGITISKHRNQLKGDIVEALQFIKCLLQKELSTENHNLHQSLRGNYQVSQRMTEILIGQMMIQWDGRSYLLMQRQTMRTKFYVLYIAPAKYIYIPYMGDKPRPRPNPGQAKPTFWLLAWLGILQSPSRLKPGQSWGFQAKPEPAHHYS